MVVPSEDYSHQPPNRERVTQGEGRRTKTTDRQTPMNQQPKNQVTMKTNSNTIQNQKTGVKGLGSESNRQTLPSGKGDDRRDHRVQIDYAKRTANRNLPLSQLVQLLQKEAPDLYSLAQIVGKWVWIQFAEKQPPTVTGRLAEFGFHWNNKRQCWQHPCGPVTVDASPEDPRGKYGATFAADVQPA